MYLSGDNAPAYQCIGGIFGDELKKAFSFINAGRAIIFDNVKISDGNGKEYQIMPTSFVVIENKIN